MSIYYSSIAKVIVHTSFRRDWSAWLRSCCILFLIIVVVIVIIIWIVVIIIIFAFINSINTRSCIAWTISFMHLVDRHHSFQKLWLFAFYDGVGVRWNYVLPLLLLLFILLLLWVAFNLFLWDFSVIWKIVRGSRRRSIIIRTYLSILLHQSLGGYVIFFTFHSWKTGKTCTTRGYSFKSSLFFWVFTFGSCMWWFWWYIFNIF